MRQTQESQDRCYLKSSTQASAPFGSCWEHDAAWLCHTMICAFGSAKIRLLRKKFPSDLGCFLKCHKQCWGFDVKLWRFLEHKKESWSVLVLAAVHIGTSRSFDRMLIVCEWHISDLSRFDGKHSCGKFIIPRLMCCAFIMLLSDKRMPTVCMSMSECEPLSKWLFTSRHYSRVST